MAGAPHFSLWYKQRLLAIARSCLSGNSKVRIPSELLPTATDCSRAAFALAGQACHGTFAEADGLLQLHARTEGSSSTLTYRLLDQDSTCRIRTWLAEAEQRRAVPLPLPRPPVWLRAPAGS